MKWAALCFTQTRVSTFHFTLVDNTTTPNNLCEQVQTLAGTEAELSEEEIYMKRLEGGLFTLQLVDYIILEVWIVL